MPLKHGENLHSLLPNVYGPGSVPWIERPIQMLRKGRMLLPMGGRGVINHVYIDNLVDGILAALERRPCGEAFNITDGVATSYRGQPRDDQVPVPQARVLDRKGAARAKLHAEGRSRAGPVAHAAIHRIDERWNMTSGRDAIKLGEPVDARLPWIRKLHALDEARAIGTTAARQRAVERGGHKLGDALRSQGQVISVRTLPTSDAPYPIRFAFNGAVRGIAPSAMLIMKNRSLLVQVQTDDGIKNVLFNPTDGPANQATPFYQRVTGKTPAALRKPFEPRPNRCAEQLAALGLGCEDIDVIAFDHFHTQDLRPLIGTSITAPRFPNALLLAPRIEWNDWDDLPMMQRAWFVVDGKKDVRTDRVVFTDHDMSLSQGLMLLRTPGHTSGNQTLFVNTDRGIYGCSENGTSADNWAPRASKMKAIRHAAHMLDLDVILNANTPELSAEQYTSMLLERAMVDRVAEAPDFFQMFPSSEVTHSLIAPHIKPSHRFGKVEHGEVVASRSAVTPQLAGEAARA